MNLDTSNKRLTVWIGKFPKYISDIILNSKSKLNIGHLSIDKNDKLATVDIKIDLSEQLKMHDIPTEHTIEIKDKDLKMYVIKNDLNKLYVEGFINKECFIKPIINSKYLEYKKLQMKNKNEENSVKIMDYFSEIRKGEKYGSLRELEILAKKRKTMLQEKKRERLDSQDVLEMIFNAFEQHDLWTVKDLADFTGQPVAYIQKLINEICVLNKKDHKSSYELKPEYKQSNM